MKTLFPLFLLAFTLQATEAATYHRVSRPQALRGLHDALSEICDWPSGDDICFTESFEIDAKKPEERWVNTIKQILIQSTDSESVRASQLKKTGDSIDVAIARIMEKIDLDESAASEGIDELMERLNEDVYPVKLEHVIVVGGGMKDEKGKPQLYLAFIDTRAKEVVIIRTGPVGH